MTCSARIKFPVLEANDATCLMSWERRFAVMYEPCDDCVKMLL